MESVRKVVQPKVGVPVDLQLLLNTTASIKAKLQVVQTINDNLEECCKTQNNYDNIVFVFLKLLSSSEPVFSPDHDLFKLRKLTLQVIHKMSINNDKMKNHIQNTMGACLKMMETDNEQSVVYCLLIFKELLSFFKPKYDGCLKTEIVKFLKLVMEMYINSNTQEKIFSFQKTSDLKVLISTIRLTTTITKNTANYILIPMGRISFKVLKDLAQILKLYYLLYGGVQSFKKEIIDFLPSLMAFFNLDIPFKQDYRDLVLDLKHAQVRLLFFFALFLKDTKNGIKLHCSTLPHRLLSFLNCNLTSDVSSLRTELLSGFENILYTDYSYEFLPYMDQFLDEVLITGRSWSLKTTLRPKAYSYIDYLVTNLHSQLSLNFLVRVIHLLFSNLLDTTLHPEMQIHLCTMVMSILNYIVQRQNLVITNLNVIEKTKNPIIELFHRVLKIFVIKLKQFQKFYLPQLDKDSSIQENVEESISSILAENISKRQQEFMYGYHPSQIIPYTIEESKRFVKIIIPSIRKILQLIVKIEGGKCSVDKYYKKSFEHFIVYSFLSLSVYTCSVKKKEMINEILDALLCIKPVHLKKLITGAFLIKLIYDNSLESIVFDIVFNQEVLVSSFGCIILEFISNNLSNENERQIILDLDERLRLHFKLHTNEEIGYIYKIIKTLMDELQDTKYLMFHLGLLKTMLIILETARFELGKNNNLELECLFYDLFSYHQRLPNYLVVLKVAIAELCLTECVFKVVLQSKLMDLLSVIAYSLNINKLSLKGLGILEKYFDILPESFFDDPVLPIRNQIMNGLYHCLNSPVESVSQPAMGLLGRFGGLNRSSIIKPENLHTQKQIHQYSKKPNIYVSFENYSHKLIKVDIGQGVNTAVESLISNEDIFNRTHSWNVIRGFLTVSMDCITDRIQLQSDMNWEPFIDSFSNEECFQYTKTTTDEIYIKALTGIMICCVDNDLKADALKCFNEFTKQFVHIAVCHFSKISCRYTLKVNPYVLIDAIALVLTNESESISNFGESALEMLIKELKSILGDTVVHFPFIVYMLRQFCELCCDISWIRKRGGCSGLQILFSNLLADETMTKTFPNWFSQHFLSALRAMLFMFSDFDGHLTFGALKIAQDNLVSMLNWLYWIKPTNSSHDSIEETIIKELLYYIIGPNDLLREQSIKMINLMAEKQQKLVMKILEPYYKHIQLSIPGSRYFNTLSFKSQLGLMKGHIFYTIYSTPAIKLSYRNKKHKYYMNTICIICQGNNKQIKRMKLLKCLSANQLIEFRQTAMQLLVNCFSFMKKEKQLTIFNILINALKSSDKKLREIANQCLESFNPKPLKLVTMVDKLLINYAKLFNDHTKVKLQHIRFVMYLSKLFPHSPNITFCTTLLNLFKHLWEALHHCEVQTTKLKYELVMKKILETMYVISETQFFHIQEFCGIILNDYNLNIDYCYQLYPLLIKCILKFPEDSIKLFFQETNIKNPIWSSFFISTIRNEESEPLRNVLMKSYTSFESLFSSAKSDPSRTIQYETIRIIYNLVQMNKKWDSSLQIVTILLNIWSNPQYKERYKNLAGIKSTEWDEPKMLIKILLTFFKNNINEVYILFQLLPVFSYRFPSDLQFFRRYLENEITKSYSIKWKRMVFYKFTELYQKKGVNGDITGKILQYLILPCFSICYKNGEKEQLLCTFTKSDENIITIFVNRILINIRAALIGCDFDGTKIFICQLICLLIKELLNYSESICDLIYNIVISCTWVRCNLDVNVKFHCYCILTFIMLNGNVSKKDKLNHGVYYELLKASCLEAQPIINHSLNVIVSTVHNMNKEVNTLVVCIKKIMTSELQNLAIINHICSFLITFNELFYPYKQFLLRSILGCLYPIAKNNNIPEFKNTAIELVCMIVKWELADGDENVKLKLPLKRKIDDEQSTTDDNLSQKKKSSETIDNCLNFLAMVGCQTYDKPDNKISVLALRSATLFKIILSTEPIDITQVNLKIGWTEKVFDIFFKKENLSKQNQNEQGITYANVMNVVAVFDVLSFLLNIICQKFMLETIKILQDHLIKFLHLAFNEAPTPSYPHNQKSIHRPNEIYVKQCNEGIIKFMKEILKTFPSTEGLEKLHTCIKKMISDGLNSNCPNKLEISLNLLGASLIHFPNYIDTDIINTIGNIMFKFDEYNKNPLTKVKCLEILKCHVDTLARVGKQVFIEKVVMENLDKARNSENNISFEVQVKCFELVTDYIKDLSEATEGILLNNTILGYIKTTTDERIMIIILNVLTKWIEICRDESVFFNCQIIEILKCITVLNRFPKFSEYCYKLNLEIYKNWNSQDCIVYGLDCKFPLIRHEFFKLYNALRHEDELNTRLNTIMSNEIIYDLELSLPFYIQLLLVKISKDTLLCGDFPLLNMEDICDLNDTLADSDELNFLEQGPVQSILTFDMCSSLTQLCFVDVNLARNIFLSIIPGVWSLFTASQRNLLSSKAVTFLANSKLKNNSMTAFYEAIILCKPKISFEPQQMVYIGKTYNLWYNVIEQMEDICNYFEHDKKNESIEGMIQLYSLLREEDVLESLFQNIIKCEETKEALSLEQLGYFRRASQKYNEQMDYEINFKQMNFNSYNIDNVFRKIHLTKCLRELNEWNNLSENLSNEDILLNIENTWKKSIGSVSCLNLRWHLEHEQKIWPSQLNWKYHFYLGMLGLYELDQQIMSIVQEHIELAVKEIIDKWKFLPKYVCNAHIPLLQATQLILEIQEAHDIQKTWLNSPENINNVDVLIKKWNNREPWIGDNLSIWNDLISWRQTYYSFLIIRDSNLKTISIKSAQDQLNLLFGKIALKHNMIGVSLNTLSNLNPEDATTSNWLYKMYLQTKCEEASRKYNKNYKVISGLNKNFTKDMERLLFIIKGSFEDYNGDLEKAFQCFSLGFRNEHNIKHNCTKWKCVIHDNFKILTECNHVTDNKKTHLNKFLTVLNNNEILENAWIQWGILIENSFNQSDIKDITIALAAIQCYCIALKFTRSFRQNIVIARILWLLSYDNDNYTLLRSLEKCNLTFSELWVPQILNIFIEKNEVAIKRIVFKIGKLYPQTMYLTLNRMYLTEKMKMIPHDAMTSQESIPKHITERKIIHKTKQMKNLLRKCNADIFQLEYFLNQIILLEESWDEELYRKLCECLYQCYDYAFKSINPNLAVPEEIDYFIKNMLMRFVDLDVNNEQFQTRKPFLVPDNLSTYYDFFKVKIMKDFNPSLTTTIDLTIKQLKKWIKYLEKNSNYPAKIVHGLRCPKIHCFDWSMIRLPCDHYLNDYRTVGIHNFSSHIYLKEKSGCINKQLTIRGTDGQLYMYNISNVESIESEERIFQLFHITNNYLMHFKETAKRFLKFSIPKTFPIAPHLRMVETNSSIYSLFEIFREMTNTEEMYDDIDYWFSVMRTCVTIQKIGPLSESLLATGANYGSAETIKNWVSMRYPSSSDYYVFRKSGMYIPITMLSSSKLVTSSDKWLLKCACTERSILVFIEHYSLICFFEYAFNLIKLKPEMLNIDENTGAASVLSYTFCIDNGNMERHCIPFRMTPSLMVFITPYRKYQIINSLTATAQCLNNSSDDINAVLKLLLKDEYMTSYDMKRQEEILINEVIEKVNENSNFILENLVEIIKFPEKPSFSNLLQQALHQDLLCFESPTWRPWL